MGHIPECDICHIGLTDNSDIPVIPYKRDNTGQTVQIPRGCPRLIYIKIFNFLFNIY